MSDQATRDAQEAKHANPLPKQVRDQMDQVNAMMTPEEGEGRDEDQLEEGAPEGDEGDGGEGDDQQPETWEQRARSALGRLEQSMTANQQLARRVSELEQQIGTVKLKPNGQPPLPESYAKPKLLKPEEIEDYGEEFFDVVGRRAKEEFAPEFEMLAERLKRLESGQTAITQVVENTQKRTLYDQLSDEVPDWRDINHHPAFLNWLSLPDVYSGVPRSELLKNAFSRQDTLRVVNFFKGFLTEAVGPPTNSSSPRNSAPPLANGNASGKPSLEDFAAPGRARSGQPQVPPDKPTYTQAWIAQFSADKRTGKYRGREADADAIERDIYQAQHEGRIF
jgi:hypothetical protein